MDNLKDISHKDSLSTFLDSTSIRTSSFGNNVAGERAYLRAERIAAATHLLTNHISPGEPLRLSSRSVAIALLGSVLKLRDEMRSREGQQLKEVQSLVRELISLVRILTVAGRVSMQNAEVVIAALDDLGVSLTTSQRTALSESVLLTREDFALGAAQAHAILDTWRRKGMRRPKDEKPRANEASDNATPVRGRPEEVLGILSTHGQLGIKDIAANLPEYSEKMVQRELKKLVASGRVKKMGAKRWSRYSLAQQ
jgi:hypothetical protein